MNEKGGGQGVGCVDVRQHIPIKRGSGAGANGHQRTLVAIAREAALMLSFRHQSRDA
jgi:hypothetical protein